MVDPRAPQESEETVLATGSTAPTSQEPAIGSTCSLPPAFLEEEFGRYRDIRVMAMGGMGQVLRAVDPELDREVAIKILKLGYEQDSIQAKRFRNESRITGQLDHPNIIPIYDSGKMSDESDFFIMKFVRGNSFAEILKSQALEREGVYDGRKHLKMFLKVCDAVDFAHSKHIVHRDLKPANVMVGQFGEVLVLDWGVAKCLDDPLSLGESSTQWNLLSGSLGSIDPIETRDGALVGTPAYMSPEQALGQIVEVDEQSDVYALGSILYEILTLERPFVALDRTSLIAQIVGGNTTPPSEKNTFSRVPWELDSVVLRAMAVNKEERYGSVSELREDLKKYLNGEALSSVSYNVPQRFGKWLKRNRAVLMVGVFAILLFGVVFGAYHWLEQIREDQAFIDEVSNAEGFLRRAGNLASLRKELPVLDSKTGLERRELPKMARRRSAAIRDCVEALSALDRALQIRPGAQALIEKQRHILRGVGFMALQGRDYFLARQAFEQLENMGAPREKIASYLERVDESAGALAKWRDSRIRHILADLRKGLARPDRPRGDPRMDDYIAEVLGYLGPQVMGLLSDALGELIRKAKRDGVQVSWTPGERDLAIFCCQILGDLGSPGCIRVLGEWADVVRGHELTVEVGRALCSTRSPEAEKPLNRLIGRIGTNSATWQEIEPFFRRIPEKSEKDKIKTPLQLYNEGIRQRKKGLSRKAFLAFTRAIEMGLATPQVFISRGNIYVERKSYRLGITDFTRAIEIDPSDVGAYKNRAKSYARIEQFDLAHKDFAKALELDPKDGMTYNMRGVMQYSRGLFRKALSDFQEAVRLDPHGANNHLNAGNAYRRLEEFQNAVDAYDKALQIKPEFGKAYILRGLSYLGLDDASFLNQAEKDFTFGIRYDPKSKAAYILRGKVRLMKSLFDRAKQDFSSAIEIDSKDPEAFYLRAMAWTAMGLMAEAAEDYRGYLRLNPKSANRAKLETFIQKYSK